MNFTASGAEKDCERGGSVSAPDSPGVGREGPRMPEALFEQPRGFCVFSEFVVIGYSYFDCTNAATA